ncbi:MAG: hypothetical protein LBC44_03520 [Mycoplasmataceae bacterium]|nr:hypothetical protein [Mycoplasmataceae bacterium]
MQVDKEYGVYLEVEEILDKREKYEFEELLKTAASTVMLRNQGNGWYYPDIERPDCFMERCGVFCSTIDLDLGKYHKYIKQLIFKESDEIIDWKADCIDDGEW